MTTMVNSNVRLENCRILFRNFSGKESKFNAAGKRNFCAVLPQELAVAMANDGWNVRYLPPRGDDEESTAYVQVAVSYDNFPPKIYKVTGKHKTELTEQTVGTLDDDDIQNVDLVIRPYNWEVNGHKGVKAYVKTMYVTIADDPFSAKYAEEPEVVNDDCPF